MPPHSRDEIRGRTDVLGAVRLTGQQVTKNIDAASVWVPAFPTDQVRGLKAHGTADLSADLFFHVQNPLLGGRAMPAASLIASGETGSEPLLAVATWGASQGSAGGG